MVQVSNSFSINYNLNRSSALALGRFNWVDPSLADGPFAIGRGRGKKILVPDLVFDLGYCKNTAEAQKKLLAKLKERGQNERSMTPREFAAFAGVHPELCRDKLIGILSSVGKNANGDQCVVFFLGVGGDWNLDLRLVRDDWDTYWCFAVVCEL